MTSIQDSSFWRRVVFFDLCVIWYCTRREREKETSFTYEDGVELCWGVCSIAWRILVLRTEELELECPWPFRLANISPISRWWKAKDFNSTSNWNARETLDHDLMLHRIKLINHWGEKNPWNDNKTVKKTTKFLLFDEIYTKYQKISYLTNFERIKKKSMIIRFKNVFKTISAL